MEKISLFDPHLTVASQISIGTKKPSPHCASALFALGAASSVPGGSPKRGKHRHSRAMGAGHLDASS